MTCFYMKYNFRLKWLFQKTASDANKTIEHNKIKVFTDKLQNSKPVLSKFHSKCQKHIQNPVRKAYCQNPEESPVRVLKRWLI